MVAGSSFGLLSSFLIGGLTSFPICSILSNVGPNVLSKTNVGVGKQGHGASHVGFLYQRQVNQELMQHCVVTMCDLTLWCIFAASFGWQMFFFFSWKYVCFSFPCHGDGSSKAHDDSLCEVTSCKKRTDDPVICIALIKPTQWSFTKMYSHYSCWSFCHIKNAYQRYKRDLNTKIQQDPWCVFLVSSFWTWC